MKICLVHNEYGKFSGEEAVVKNQIDLLQNNNHEVLVFSGGRKIATLGAGDIVGELSLLDHGPRTAAPCLGEHTAEVLSEVLGLSAAEVTELDEAGVLR